MAIKLTMPEYDNLEHAAVEAAREILSSCTSQANGNIPAVESCVLSRLLGLEYVKNIVDKLPENHPLKIDDDTYSNIQDIMRKQVLSYVK